MRHKVILSGKVRAVNPALEPQECYERKERQSAVREIMLAVPLKYRDVLYLYYFEELKIREIARVLDLSQSGVKTRLKRGREHMRVILEKRGWTG